SPQGRREGSGFTECDSLGDAERPVPLTRQQGDLAQGEANRLRSGLQLRMSFGQRQDPNRHETAVRELQLNHCLTKLQLIYGLGPGKPNTPARPWEDSHECHLDRPDRPRKRLRNLQRREGVAYRLSAAFY